MHRVPLIIRGEVIEAPEIEFSGRRGGARFRTADVRMHIDRLALGSASPLSDLYNVTFDEILDYLRELERCLALGRNRHLQQACALSIETSGLSQPILTRCYETMGRVFAPAEARQLADRGVGIPFLEGWVEIRRVEGYREEARAFGARTVHIVAGNSPFVTAMSFVRNIVTRSDGIFKTPSNDPLTAAAIAATMIEMAPDHPITRHVSVAYWKGGDADIEDSLYRPRNIEKIVAWGGMASVRHITKYVEPGIDLITLDPKLSSSIIGRDAFASEAAMRDAADRLAHDIGYNNQEVCSSARVVYVETGTTPPGLRKANEFGKRVFEAIQSLPSFVSGPAAALNPALKEELATLRYTEDFTLVAGGGREGAIVVSQIPEPVEFAHLLQNRVANLIPIDDVETAIRSTTASTQTVGVFPDQLADRIKDRLAFHGAQRIVSLGYANAYGIPAIQDGMEPMRRMCKWILRETTDREVRPLMAYKE